MKAKVPRRHTFRRLRNYHQIWPFSEEAHGWWMEPGDPRPPQTEPLPITPKSVGDHPADKYLDNRLHDSRVIEVRIGTDSVELELDDYDVWRLSTAYEERATAAKVEYFPVILEFRQINAWAAYQTNYLGHLSKLRHSIASNFSKLRHFHGDQVTQWDANRIVTFFEMRPWPERETRVYFDPSSNVGISHSHDLLLAIDAGELVVHERQREAWNNAFGEPALAVFDAYRARRADFVHGGFHLFEELVDSVLEGRIP